MFCGPYFQFYQYIFENKTRNKKFLISSLSTLFLEIRILFPVVRIQFLVLNMCMESGNNSFIYIFFTFELFLKKEYLKKNLKSFLSFFDFCDLYIFNT